MALTFTRVRDEYGRWTRFVPMNGVGFADWPPESHIQFLVTSGLNGCTGVAIVSPKAGILAHIAPLPLDWTYEKLRANPNLGQENLDTRLREISNLLRVHGAKFDPAETYVFAGIYPDPNTRAPTPGQPETIRRINQFMSALRLPIIWKSYPVLPTTQSRPDGYSTIVVHAYAQGRMPKVYFNDTAQN